MGQTQLRSIVGEPLSGVAFIQDYVELHFDGQILRAFTKPTIMTRGQRYCFPEQGSRDAFCQLIGIMVKEVLVEESLEIRVGFVDGAVVSIPLDIGSRDGPEAAHYVPGLDLPIEVW
ncbi:MAG: hypothetical protein HC897_01365 [Thermoanaerobaculia bacterium]|nr:hypothetical protein [Thermoanaerobaculia bacterium]